MKKYLVTATSVIMTMSVVATAHADKQWTGFYMGADANIAFNDAQLKSQQLGFTSPSNTCNQHSTFSTFAPGAQFGYIQPFYKDYVSGIEANITMNTHQTETLTCASNINAAVYDRFTFRNQMQSSIKARLGHAVTWYDNSFLPYLTAGASFAKLGLNYRNEGGNYYSTNTTQIGWLIGAGIEWPFKQHWSLRAEYYFVDYGDAINLKIPSIYGLEDPNGNGHVNLSANNVAFSLNYWV